MRIVVSADWHLDWMTAGLNRFEDLTAAVENMVEFIEQSKSVDAFLFLGDLTNPDNPRSWRAVEFAIQVDRRLQTHGTSTMWLVGNHDVVEDGFNSSTLLPLRAAGAWVVSEPIHTDLFCGKNIAALPFNLIALPFTPRSHAYSPADFVSECIPHGEGKPLLIIGHLHIEGIEPGSESGDMARGREVFLPLDTIAQRFPNAVVLNGHYHRRQEFESKEAGSRGVRVHVPGSLARLTRGERDNSPGYIIVEV